MPMPWTQFPRHHMQSVSIRDCVGEGLCSETPVATVNSWLDKFRESSSRAARSTVSFRRRKLDGPVSAPTSRKMLQSDNAASIPVTRLRFVKAMRTSATVTRGDRPPLRECAVLRTIPIRYAICLAPGVACSERLAPNLGERTQAC